MNSESGMQLPNELKRVIVFGGAGFIDSHLLKALAAANPQIEFFSVDIAEPRFKVDVVHYVTHDVTKTVPRQLCGRDAAMIFNLAAVHTTPGHEDWEYYRTNILGACNICQFATDIDAKHNVFTSSISVYGPSDEPKNEDSELEPASAHGWGKLGLKTTVNRARVKKLFHSTNIIPKTLQESGFRYSYSLPSSLADWRSFSAKREFV
jgi:nucleoside-diphosphate-sugar epimerase